MKPRKWKTERLKKAATVRRIILNWIVKPQQPIQSKVYFIEDYVAMLLEDADKLLEKLVELGDEVINDYAVTTATSLSLFCLWKPK